MLNLFQHPIIQVKTRYIFDGMPKKSAWQIQYLQFLTNKQFFSRQTFQLMQIVRNDDRADAVFIE